MAFNHSSQWSFQLYLYAIGYILHLQLVVLLLEDHTMVIFKFSIFMHLGGKEHTQLY